MQLKTLFGWLAAALGITGVVFSAIFFFAPTSNLSGLGQYAKPISPARHITNLTKQTNSLFTQNLIESLVTSIQNALLGKKVNVLFGQASSGLSVSPIGKPIRLKIPKIKVDAPVIYVGMTSDGAMNIPKDPADVAWFNLGPRPGEQGSAVMNGHFGWKNNIPAVFDKVNTLKKGDKVYVIDGKGATITFVVRELRSYGEYEDASNVFFSGDGVSHLNLITCQGIWNKANKSYSNRLVVFTDKETENIY